VRTVTDALESFDSLTGAQALEQLVDDLSNWYVRRSRPRFWKSSDPAAHATLHECLTILTQILAPYCPFLADELYGNLAPSKGSVHLADWPDPDLTAIDDELEAEMNVARTLVSLGRKARNEARIGVRQPLPRAIALLGRDVVPRDEVVQEIADELNVKRFEVVSSLEGLLSYRVVPNFRVLGPRVGKSLPRVKELLATIDGAVVRQAFDDMGRFDLEVEGQTVTLQPGDVEIRAEQHEELALAQDGPHAVALDLTLDDDLRAEGKAREFSRVLNDLRKANGFEISDRIRVHYGADDEGLMRAIARHREWIATEALATTLEPFDGARPEKADLATVAGEPIRVELSLA
jgi:isoleucyl-tRNA synthetase